MSQVLSQDAANLWATYESLRAKLNAIVALELAVANAIGVLQSGGTPDYAGISEGDGMSSASYTVVSLQQRLDNLTADEERTAATMERVRLLAIKAEPGLFSARIPVNRTAGCVFNQ